MKTLMTQGRAQTVSVCYLLEEGEMIFLDLQENEPFTPSLPIHSPIGMQI